MGQVPRAAFYRSLLALKHAHPALTSTHEPGNLELIETGNPKVFAFRRIKGADRVRVEVNVSPEAQRYQVAGKARSLAPWRWAISARR